jgi:Cof subfamily protein (haloacid dehalogenase superfamily)
MIQPYLIALDLDGTLLNKDKVIDQKTLKYLRKLSQHHYIVIATGRPYRAFIKFYEQLGLKTPMVAYNGAYVTHPHDAQFTPVSFSFPKEVVSSIYRTVGPNIIENIMCETNHEIWLIHEEDNLASFFWHDNMTIVYGDITQTLTKNPMTMILKSKERNEKNDQIIIDAVRKHPGLNIRFWGDSVYSEVFYSHISKGSALLNLLDYYHVPKERFIAFGDAENDIEMLTYAPLSVAMVNGVDHVKKIANFISTYDNNHQGIVDMLKNKFKLR